MPNFWERWMAVKMVLFVAILALIAVGTEKIVTSLADGDHDVYVKEEVDSFTKRCTAYCIEVKPFVANVANALATVERMEYNQETFRFLSATENKIFSMRADIAVNKKLPDKVRKRLDEIIVSLNDSNTSLKFGVEYAIDGMKNRDAKAFSNIYHWRMQSLRKFVLSISLIGQIRNEFCLDTKELESIILNL